MMSGGGRRLPAIAAMIALCTAGGCAPRTDEAARTTPSGLAVPRYVTLKFDPVNARAGPGDDHRLLWVYHARGLPVQVVAETAEWRRICDPDGGLAWVHRRTTDGRRALLQLGSAPLALHVQPRDEAKVSAYLAPRAIADFDRCEKDWCRVRIGSAAGWAPSGAFWGVSDAPQCPKPPAVAAQ